MTNDNTDKNFTRAYASFRPKWQRFDLNSAPKKSKKSEAATTSKSKGKTPPQASTQAQHPYNRQYSHVYTHRLSDLRDRCLSSAATTASSSSSTKKAALVVPRIIELRENEVCTIVGTFVKECPDRPKAKDSSYHDSVSHDYSDKIDPPMRNCANAEKDSLWLEDESGRVELQRMDDDGNDEGGISLPLDVHGVATGVVAAVTGIIPPDLGGVMIVSSVSFPEQQPIIADEHDDKGDEVSLQNALDSSSSTSSTTDSDNVYVMLVSGLHCGMTSRDEQEQLSHSLKTDMLIDYIAGNLPGLESSGARIARVIIAGGSAGGPTTESFQSHRPTKNSDKKTKTSSVNVFPIKELDLVVSNLLSEDVPVDIIPGLHDPTNATWPQQPFHRCLFPHSCLVSGSNGKSNLFHRAPNPYEACIGGIRFLGSDGLNVSDLSHYMIDSTPKKEEEEETETNNTRYFSSCDILEKTLQFGHMAPTAPDSIPCFPFGDNHNGNGCSQDPFVISSTPRVYFCGNSSKFETKTVGGLNYNNNDGEMVTRLICIPSFRDTGEVVLINLKTLETECLLFNGDGSGVMIKGEEDDDDSKMDTT